MINSDKNKESITFVWYDATIGLNEDSKKTKKRLRQINDYVVFHTDLELCVSFIQSIENERIFLICTGSSAAQLLARINSLTQLDSIFIFCYQRTTYEHLCIKYSKIVGVYNDINSLCISLQEQTNLVDKQLHQFALYNQNQHYINNLSQESSTFIWYHLFNDAFMYLPRNEQAKRELVQVCRRYYRDNHTEQQLIDQFELEYRSEEAIRWYSKQSFVYKMINKALRTGDIDQLHMFRFFIGDLSENLAREHQNILQSDEEILTVYRGAHLAKDELDRLKDNEGKLISTNGFLSTSRLRSKAIDFAMKSTRRIDSVPVLFEIECNIQELGDDIIFADITKFSDYPEEQEVLFDLSVTFQLGKIQYDGQLWLIKMKASAEGKAIIRTYIEETHREMEYTNILNTLGKLMFQLGQYNKALEYFQRLLINSNEEDLPWIEYNIGQAFYFKSEWKASEDYYRRAYQRMMNAQCPRIKDSAYVLDGIGFVLNRQGKFDESIKFHQQALTIRETCYDDNHIFIAFSLNNMGLNLMQQENYHAALTYLKKSLQIGENCYPQGHIDVAILLTNIGDVLRCLEQYDDAFDYSLRALEMLQKCYPLGHVQTSHTMLVIGTILSDRSMYNQAFVFYQRASEMGEKFYPSEHIEMAKILNEIGRIYYCQGKLKHALEVCQRALAIQEKVDYSAHSDIVNTLINISRILCDQKKYEQALQCCERAITIQEKHYPFEHADVANTLINISKIYHAQEKYDEALKLGRQALAIQEKVFFQIHSSIANSLIWIGTILSDQARYKEALEYYYRAHAIFRNLHSSSHPDIVMILNIMGNLFSYQQKFDEAQEFYQQALEMQRELYPTGHHDIIVTLHNIGNLFNTQEQYDDALGYYHQALDLEQKLYPFDQATIAISLNDIGSILGKQRRYDEALIYHRQALKRRRKMYIIDHSDIIDSLICIATILTDQERYDEALEFHYEALNILQKLYPSDHLDIATSLYNIGIIFLAKYDHSVAIHYLEKALQIRMEWLKPEHPCIGITVETIITAYESNGQYDHALNYALKYLTFREIHLSLDHDSTIECLPASAHCHILQCEQKLAYQYNKRTATLKKTLNIKNNNTGECLTKWFDRQRKHLYELKRQYFPY